MMHNRKKQLTISSQPFGYNTVVGVSETCAAILSCRGPSFGALNTPPRLDKSGLKNLICRELGICNNIYLLPCPRVMG